MKKYYFLMALAATAIMSACSTENEFAPQTSGAKVNFYVDNGPITRTTVDKENASTKFVEGDEIGIFATGGATGSNVGYKVSAGTEGTLSPIGSDIEWTTADEGNFYAYYPYAAGNVTDKVNFTVTDQTDADEFAKNDFLVATKTSVSNQTDIKFQFAHGLSLVQVVLNGDKAAEATEVTLTAKPTVEWAFADNTFTTSGDAKAIKMWKIADNPQTYWAMVPAQTIPAEAFVKITASGKNYTYTPSEAIKLSTAKIKKFNLQLGKAGQAISVSTNMNTDDWTDDENPTDGNTEEKTEPAVELISAADGTFTAETVFNTVTQKQNCVKGWNSFMADANGKIEVVDGALQIAATTGSWHNSTAYYCAEGATPATYELVFKAQTDAVTEKDIQISVIACSEANDYFVRVGLASSYIYQTLGAEYAEYKFKFDLSKIRRGAANATEEEASASDLSKILIYFTPKKKTGENFYIKDVTFIEVKE